MDGWSLGPWSNSKCLWVSVGPRRMGKVDKGELKVTLGGVGPEDGHLFTVYG
jgi:hypothetical protein